MNSKPLFRSHRDVRFILPASDAQDVSLAVSLAVLRNTSMSPGTLTTPAGSRPVIVAEGHVFDRMAVASLMWRFGFRGTLMATPYGLWLVHPEAPSVLGGVRLRTKTPWRISYGLVDAVLTS